MDTQIQKHPGGWTKSDGVQPVRDTVVVEVVFGVKVPPDTEDAARLLGREVNWSYKHGLWWRKA